MSRVEITTLNASLVEPDVQDDDDYGSESVDVVVCFGEAEVTRWSVTAPYFRYVDDRRRFLEEAVADRLRPLFEMDKTA